MSSRVTRQDSGSSDERAFLDQYDVSAFERPSVAIDVVLLTATEGSLRVLTVRRHEHPAKGELSLPGGFVRMDESLDEAADRVILEKAGLSDVFVEQLYTFGDVARDPRTRVISVAYYALVDPVRLLDAPDADAADRCILQVDVPWEGEAGGPARVLDDDGSHVPLAFDHEEILGTAVKRIRGKLNYSPIGFQLLPNTFTLRRLQLVHETILARELNKDAFRRRMLATGLLEPSGEREREVGHRPAELYRFQRGHRDLDYNGSMHGRG